MPTGKGVLRIAIEDFIETFGFGKRVGSYITENARTLKDGSLGEAWARIINEVGANDDLPSFLKAGSPPAVLGIAAVVPMLLGAMIGLGFSFITVMLQPLFLLAQYRVAHKYSYFRIAPSQLAQLLKSFPEKKDDWLGQLLDLGVDEKSLNGLQALNLNRLLPLQYIALWKRGKISDAIMIDQLKRLNMLDTDIDWLVSLTDVIPGVQDLITLQVKEAFNDEASARFHHDEGDYSQAAEWAAKQGLSQEWVKRYWRAHWQLPSPGQVFEMLQRLRPGKSQNPVTDADVKEYLQIADYSPFWRERLTEIAYAPFTRVDVRRMFKLGVLTEAQVMDAYLDAGYNKERAEALTKFTVAYEAEEETGIGRSAVMSAYGDGMIDRATAEQMLGQVGYDSATVAFYLNNIDFQHAQQINQIKLANIKKKYIEGMIDETTVNSEINQLNLPAERVTALLELWNTERANQTALLTLSQMETLLERGIVSDADYRLVAKQRGYDDKSIGWTLARIAQEAAKKAQDDAEKAQADQERLQKSKTASQYQKDKAAHDLGIAQAKAEITDINIALQGDVSETDQTSLIERKKELTQFIADVNVKKAQLRLDTTSLLNDLTKS